MRSFLFPWHRLSITNCHILLLCHQHTITEELLGNSQLIPQDLYHVTISRKILDLKVICNSIELIPYSVYQAASLISISIGSLLPALSFSQSVTITLVSNKSWGWYEIIPLNYTTYSSVLLHVRN